jgi:hypothetical protein
MPEIDIQNLYNEIEAKKAEKKIIKGAIKDHYDSSPTFKNISDELKKIKAKKKAYDMEVREAFGKDFDELARLDADIRADDELLSDLCFRELQKGNAVEIKDKNGKKFEPVIKVVFRKAP